MRVIVWASCEKKDLTTFSVTAEKGFCWYEPHSGRIVKNCTFNAKSGIWLAEVAVHSKYKHQQLELMSPPTKEETIDSEAENGKNGETTSKFTMEERKAKMEELRQKMVSS